MHKLIYGNTRVLWRTERLLVGADMIVFPEAYREWIEHVYQDDDQDNEPKIIKDDYQGFTGKQLAARAEAKRLTMMTVKSFRDEDYAATALTRDGEMSLTVLPIQPDGRLLDGQVLSALNERDLAETLNLHTVPVPASWEKRLTDCRRNDDGLLLLEMTMDGNDSWSGMEGKFCYSEDFGLEKNEVAGQKICPAHIPTNVGNNPL